jgi:anti-sigma B factor antagonist
MTTPVKTVWPVLSINLDHIAGGYIVCRLEGDLDLSSICHFRQALADLTPGCRLLIDMSSVSFVDSAGLGALVGAIRRVRENGGDVAVACHRHALSRLLLTVGLDRVVTITDNIQDAKAALSPG